MYNKKLISVAEDGIKLGYLVSGKKNRNNLKNGRAHSIFSW